MPKYLVIFRTETVWTISGTESRTSMNTFDDMEQARKFADDLEEMWPDWKDLQIYEYTGIQYVIVDRRHKKNG